MQFGVIILKKITSLIIILLTISSLSTAQNISIRPIRDDIGFSWNAADMNNLIDYLKNNSDDVGFSSDGLVAAISPHDDYLYAGRIYYPLYKLIKAKEIVVFGVTHSTVRRVYNDPRNIMILDNFDLWRGPYKYVKVSKLRQKIKNKMDKKYFIVNNDAQYLEHSIEAVIPFLQYYNRDFKITPIMITQSDTEHLSVMSQKLSQIIAEYIKDNSLELGKDIFFLISNDANHYGKDFNNSPYGIDKIAHKQATKNDIRIINSYLNKDIDLANLNALSNEIFRVNNPESKPLWCGRYPVIFGLLTVKNIIKKINGKNLSGKLFKYSDTVTEKVLPLKNTSLGITAPFSNKHWVGFFSAGFYLK